MHSTMFAFLAVAGLSSAAALPYSAECAGSGAYYVCANNNFRGYCSVDPCAIKWCPDFYDQTCVRFGHTTGNPPKPNATCTTVTTVTVTPTVVVDPPVMTDTFCANGGYYQVCSNGFKGCCKSDVCRSDKPYCPHEPPKDCSPHCSVTTTATSTTTIPAYVTPTPSCKSCNGQEPTTEACSGGTGQHYVCANNGFRGRCSVDPCALSWCPDYTKDTCTPKEVTSKPLCPKGTGSYQICSNGFRGCCNVDACAGPNPVCSACIY